MKDKLKSLLKSVLLGLIFAGVIMLAVGFYYQGIKAGIPYQDPTEEMQLQYTIYWKVGEELIYDGFMIGSTGLVLRIIVFMVERYIKRIRGTE